MLHLINTLPALSLTVTKPSPSLAPIEVVNAQLEALSAGDVHAALSSRRPPTSSKPARGKVRDDGAANSCIRTARIVLVL